jgi:23S rRNA G2445 N2-methylase RlmL
MKVSVGNGKSTVAGGYCLLHVVCGWSARQQQQQEQLSKLFDQMCGSGTIAIEGAAMN